MALLRDVAFSAYPVSALATQAAAELTTLHNAALVERGLGSPPLAAVDGSGGIAPTAVDCDSLLSSRPRSS